MTSGGPWQPDFSNDSTTRTIPMCTDPSNRIDMPHFTRSGGQTGPGVLGWPLTTFPKAMQTSLSVSAGKTGIQLQERERCSPRIPLPPPRLCRQTPSPADRCTVPPPPTTMTPPTAQARAVGQRGVECACAGAARAERAGECSARQGVPRVWPSAAPRGSPLP